jgi:hypothetical protein
MLLTSLPWENTFAGRTHQAKMSIDTIPAEFFGRWQWQNNQTQSLLVSPHSTVVGCGVHLTGQHIVDSWNRTTRYSGHTACHTGTTVNCGATEPIELTVQFVGSNDTDQGDIDRMTGTERGLALKHMRLWLKLLCHGQAFED